MNNTIAFSETATLLVGGVPVGKVTNVRVTLRTPYVERVAFARAFAPAHATEAEIRKLAEALS